MIAVREVVPVRYSNREVRVVSAALVLGIA